MSEGDDADTWLERIARSRSGQLLLYWYAVLEAAFIPVPFEAVLAPYMHMRPDIRWRLPLIGIAGYATVAVLAYGLGALFHEAAAEPLIARFGWAETYDDVHDQLNEGGLLAMIVIVALPIPTMVAHIGAGTVGMPLWMVLTAVVAVRGTRYAVTAVLVAAYGERVLRWMRDRQARKRQPPR